MRSALAGTGLTWAQIEAYWASEGECSDRKTAEWVGGALRTIGRHRLEGRWAEHFLAEHQVTLEMAAALAKVRIRAYLAEVTDELLAIITKREPVRDSAGRIITDDDGEPIVRHVESGRIRV